MLCEIVAVEEALAGTAAICPDNVASAFAACQARRQN
jgi:hypothetical protein